MAAADGTGGRRCGRADGTGGQVSEGGRGEVELKAAQRMARAEGVIYSSPDSRSWQMRPWGIGDFICIFTCLLMESMDGGVLISPDCARLIVDLSDALEGGAGALAGKYS